MLSAHTYLLRILDALGIYCVFSSVCVSSRVGLVRQAIEGRPSIFRDHLVYFNGYSLLYCSYNSAVAQS